MSESSATKKKKFLTTLVTVLHEPGTQGVEGPVHDPCGVVQGLDWDTSVSPGTNHIKPCFEFI
jgi:hypothetical protein